MSDKPKPRMVPVRMPVVLHRAVKELARQRGMMVDPLVRLVMREAVLADPEAARVLAGHKPRTTTEAVREALAGSGRA